MSDSGKKRINSFRKIFPNLFFSNKSKEKSNKLTHMGCKKSNLDNSSNSNQYENPKIVKVNVLNTNNDIGRIYENLAIEKYHKDMDSSCNISSSNHSSSSTLVSESVKPQLTHNEDKSDFSKEYYKARPQVPPKPYNELSNVLTTSSHQDKIQFPDVYYHSVEKLTESITPLHEIEVFQAQSFAKPASVGAEIKRVSTKFLISPKKEAEVRTIQPKRARSFSFDNNNKNTSTLDQNIHNHSKMCKENITKSYNYSAPTSPVPTNHKIPNMPKTVSPYGHVKKSMNESEERRNSLNRSSLRNPLYPAYKLPVDSNSENVGQKAKARQKLEAFYWQKLKELKQREDEFLLEQSLNSTLKRVSHKNAPSLSYSGSLPRSYKTNSLPRDNELRVETTGKACTSNPFTRGVPERWTDTFLRYQSNPRDVDVVYRYPEKMQPTQNRKLWPQDTVDTQGYLRKSLNNDSRSSSLQPKRVSFEEKIYDTYPKYICSQNEAPGIDTRSKEMITSPPRPPIRTTSVGTNKIVNNRRINHPFSGHYSLHSESESGSEASEIQWILQSDTQKEDDWRGDGSRMDGGLSDGEASRVPARGRSSRRDDPRRHTLAGNHLYVHPHHPSQLNSHQMDHWTSAGQVPLYTPEYATVNKSRDNRQNRIIDARALKPPLPRGYPPPNSAMLFDDDPGIMSEVETASTGFRRGGKQRSSLPVVRTPSKTLERPLGLVFLQYRSETKRALLPNEITSIDTVKALFVRSFPKQLTMQYMDSPMVKIYIHDSSKDMFYELEDVRAHLRDIRDRSVLRLFEATDMGGGVFPGAVGVGSLAMPPGAATCSGPPSWEQDQSYFSEPEIDSEYHHQHVHKTKVKAPAYYMGTAAPSTLPRGGSLLRAFSPAAPPVPADRSNTLPGAGHGSEGYMSSPERGSARAPYEDPYYTQFLGPAAGRPNITPVIDEETSEGVVIDDAYQMYGVNAVGGAPRPMPRPPYDARLNPQVEDIQRLRVEKMERQLANLTGLVQKALQVPGAAPAPAAPTAPAAAPRQQFQSYQPRSNAQDAARFPGNDRPPKLGRDKFQKSVSFEKSVSFSDDPPDMNSPIQHSPQHSERDRLKPAPPPKPAGLVGQQLALVSQKIYTINVTPDFFNDMRVLQKQSRDLRIETRNLRRSTLSHAIQMRQLMADTIVKIGALAASFYERDPESQLTREEEIYRQDMLLLENDLYELEATVERLRGQAANRETRVNMADIERIAMVLSKSSKTVADWKLKFPILQDTMKVKLASEMEKVVRKEKMLEEEPERLELALRRCKKLTGTLVTLKRLACVQEQRLPAADGRVSPGSSQGSSFTAGPSSEEFASDTTTHIIQPSNKGTGSGRGTASRGAAELRPENALDALLDELQTFAKPAERSIRGAAPGGEGPLRRLHSYPSGSDTDASPPVRARGQHPPKPPVPERHPELLALAARRAPPPPPPRTTSRSPLASPTSPSSPPNADSSPPDSNLSEEKTALRQSLLEQRHQELLKKQKALQEQYARLQMIQRTGPSLPPTAQPDLKKTGSESNLLTKMNLNLTATNISGSMTHLACDGEHQKPTQNTSAPSELERPPAPDTIATTNKVYETDIL
ncbi:coiled-coil domain-containing protein CG32809 isoform X5 [Cydia pomonella]|uniref:coiled-coil domain-containing protein CG32809 isoform X5 n=1 Tax=Cydia pomonella TaxID=82600 RepID=UPI002ADE198D|nr:coiled-coil domain-containing protein CG32809 isoform X5 [Cydia pomonella]